MTDYDGAYQATLTVINGFRIVVACDSNDIIFAVKDAEKNEMIRLSAVEFVDAQNQVFELAKCNS